MAPMAQSVQPKRTKAAILRGLVAAVVLCSITLLAYSDSFRSGFVYDNQRLILQDPRIFQATAKNVELILQHTYWWPRDQSGLYRPVTTLSYLFNYAVLGEGDHPTGYHWFNFFLHALNVLLLFMLSLRLVRRFWVSVLIAAFWAVHPVLTESVTNIVGRADLLAAASSLSGFLFYLRSTESKGWKRVAWLTGLAAVAAVGVFSKESAVAIVGVIVVCELIWWKERRQLRGLLLGCAAIAPAFLALFYQRSVVLANAAAMEISFAENPLAGAHFLTARLTSIAVMARYLWLLVWPAKLSVDYSYSAIPLASGSLEDWIAWIAVFAVSAVAAWQYRRNKLLLFFAAVAFVTLLPVSNLLFSTGTIMAERFLYLPAAGFAACVVLVTYSAGQFLGSRAVAPALLCLMIVALGIRAWERNLDWRDEISLWTSAVRAKPNSFKSHQAMSVALYQSDPSSSNISRVIDEAEKSLVILDPLPDARNSAQAYASTGTYYVIKGDLSLRPGSDRKPIASPESVLAYERGLQVLKRGASIDKAFANAYVQRERARGKSDSQIPPYGIFDLYENLATTAMRLGDQKTALDAANHARTLAPDDLDVYLVLSNIFLLQGNREDAATILVEGSLISGNRAFLQPLRELYRAGLDPKGCAIVNTGGGESLDNSCEPVHAEICRASADMVEVYRSALRSDLAEQTEERALDEFGCSLGVLN